MLFDRAFGEHVGFMFQLSVVVQDLQGTEQVVTGITVKGQTVCTTVDQAVSTGVCIAKLV